MVVFEGHIFLIYCLFSQILCLRETYLSLRGFGSPLCFCLWSSCTSENMDINVVCNSCQVEDRSNCILECGFC